MVTWDELQKRKDSDAILIRVMLSWLLDSNEHDWVGPKDMFEDCRNEALEE
ncbi:hypothetical protein LCGC14_2537520 [marine sediment metagenome]|uniref:Uncharacterized protein n=1 Tax=marine sediment metagenome TaxID=412755 RepID=A0A0F9AS75_9ZZZZ